VFHLPERATALIISNDVHRTLASISTKEQIAQPRFNVV
jgi:hypothetical protein